MSTYFKRAADYYIFVVNISGHGGKQEIAQRCRAKYPRGINLVAVDESWVGEHFTPHCCVDPGRIFLTYERLMKEALDPAPEEDDFYLTIKNLIDTYDPEKELLYVVMRLGGPEHEAYVYRVKI